MLWGTSQFDGVNSSSSGTAERCVPIRSVVIRMVTVPLGRVPKTTVYSSPVPSSSTSLRGRTTTNGSATGLEDTVAGSPNPALFSARTWKRYLVPLVSPLTVTCLAPAPPDRFVHRSANASEPAT